MGVSRALFFIYCFTKTTSRRPQRGTVISLCPSISPTRVYRWACSPSHCTYHICELSIFQRQYHIRNRDSLAYHSKRSQLRRELLELVHVSIYYFSIFLKIQMIYRFDLWEEVNSSSFYTTAVQHRALREGVTLANRLGQTSTSYSSQAGNLLCFLQVSTCMLILYFVSPS